MTLSVDVFVFVESVVVDVDIVDVDVDVDDDDSHEPDRTRRPTISAAKSNVSTTVSPTMIHHIIRLVSSRRRLSSSGTITSSRGFSFITAVHSAFLVVLSR